MKRSHIFFAAFFLTIFVVSCSKSNETDLGQNNNGTPDNNTCDTTDMKFTTDIKPILQSYCYDCHSNANAHGHGQDVRMEDYADVQDHALDGMLLGVITHATNFPAMPLDRPKLSDCNINKIKAWIDRGAQEN